jgi:hypothetical protein
LRGGSAWKPDGLCAADWKADAPLMANDHSRARLIGAARAAPVPLRVGRRGGLWLSIQRL